jgi:hypothetical protein
MYVLRALYHLGGERRVDEDRGGAGHTLSHSYSIVESVVWGE